MAARRLLERWAERGPGRNFGGEALGDPLADDAPGGQESVRAETIQRLQIGVTTLAVMLTMIALASVVGTQAKLAEEAAVPDAAPTTEPTETPAQRDPLVDAGVVPDIPAEEEDARARRQGERPRVIVPDTPPRGASGGAGGGAQGGAAPRPANRPQDRPVTRPPPRPIPGGGASVVPSPASGNAAPR